MIRNIIMTFCISMALISAVLWPVSHWWYSTWYDTFQTGPLTGYWGGYALVDGDFSIHWDSPNPPTMAPKIFFGIPIEEPFDSSDIIKPVDPDDGNPFLSIESPDRENPITPRAYTYYDMDAEINLSFLGWKFEYNRASTRGSMSTPLPLLAAVFTIFSLALGAYNPMLRRRRRKHNLCEKCSYNLTGNTTGICPECGTPTTQRC